MTEAESEPMLENSINRDLFLENNNVTDIPNLNSTLKTSSDKRIELIWRNLSYSITEQNFNPFESLCKRKSGTNRTRQLIKSLNGRVVSGQLTGILGPSGAGKTTLIECLAGRRRNGVSGQIFANYRGFATYLFSFYFFPIISLFKLFSIHKTLL
jgi:ABC-type glutathione transport system ATPase component